MPYDPSRHHRRSVRLKGYDYSQPGVYFVTLVTNQRQNLFGQVVKETMQPNAAGKIVAAVWQELPRHFPSFRLVAYVVMPNHFHALVEIEENDLSVKNQPSTGPQKLEKQSLGAAIAWFKAAVTRRVQNKLPNVPVWQRGYYEHIIRSDQELGTIHAYITRNPVTWTEDEHYLASSAPSLIARSTSSADTRNSS